MEIGTPFIVVVLYSVAGYIIFQGASLLALAYFARHRETIGKGKFLTLFGVLLTLAIASGPLTWGNLIRRSLLRQEEA